ncbi:MAG TPA: hypothetical protein VK963_02195 [Candidatus Saccharimonadales bacterium]|nr:hypothetical protein [Candidatus Saccharimonadales bacterium]
MKIYDAKDQRGLVLLFEVILITLVLGVAGFAGYRAYQSSRKPVQTTNQEQPPAAQSSTTYLTIASTRVRIPLNDKTKNLKLGQVKPSFYDQNDKSAAIIAPELDAAWTCEKDADEQFRGTIGSISITTGAKRSGPHEPIATKQVGGYTYGFETGGSNCAASPQYKELVDAFKVQFGLLESY